jgi:Glycosyltransferase family 87
VTRNSKITTRVLKALLGVALTVVLGFVLARHSKEIRSNVVERDSIAYWTAGRLLLAHQNPYDPRAVLALESQNGYRQDKPLVLRTPPWSLFVVLPLGMMGPLGAWVLWTAVSLGSLLIAMRTCWRLYGTEGVPRNLFSLIGYTFAPVPACLVAGQMGLVLLLGLMLFLWWERDHPIWAGAALILPFAKPHLLSLFWFGVLFWIILGKKRAVAFGFGAALVITTGLALAFDPSVLRHYREMLSQAAIGYEFIPALSGVLRLLFFRRQFWAQFIPMIAGLIWAAWFLWRHRENWDWRQHAPILLVVSVLTTPYAWLTDEVVLLPAMLQGVVFIYQSRANMKNASRVALLAFGLLDGFLLLILRFKIPFASGIYFWSSLVWFSWYVYARRREALSLSEPESGLAHL